jgi:hypothetical protein
MGQFVGVAPSEGHHTANSIFEQYPAAAGRLSKSEQNQIKRTARTLFETSPSDAIGYLASQRGYTNWRPDKLIGKLSAKGIDYEKYRDLGTSAFQDFLGREMSDSEWALTSSLAKTKGIKDPAAFEAFLSQRLASTPEGQSKMKTEADIAWESQYGTMPRDAQGNLIRGMVRHNPGNVKSLISSMLG